MPIPGRKYPPEITRQKMVDWCNKAERTQWDVRKKLMDWNIPSLERENLIADLISLDLLNEKRYASAFAHDKSKFNRWGKVKIRMHLKSKGISDRNIADALQSLEPEDVATSIVQLIKKKLPSLKGLQPWQKKFKLLQYLLLKGYTREDAEVQMRKFLGDTDENL